MINTKACASLVPAPDDDAQRLKRVNIICQQFRHKFAGVHHLTPDELQALVKARPVALVDVRAKEEYEVSTIPGSVHISEFNPPQGASIVCFCTVGMRSSLHALRFAREKREVYSMDGIITWAHMKGPLVEPATGTPTDKIHVFSPTFAPMVPRDATHVVFRPRSCSLYCETLRTAWLVLLWKARQL